MWILSRIQKDCPRCFTYPTADCPGQHQTLQDSIFHGYTENIGNIHPDRGDFMKEKGEIKPVSSTTVQGGVEMYTYWYKAPDGIYRTQDSFQIAASLRLARMIQPKSKLKRYLVHIILKTIISLKDQASQIVVSMFTIHLFQLFISIFRFMIFLMPK